MKLRHALDGVCEGVVCFRQQSLTGISVLRGVIVSSKLRASRAKTSQFLPTCIPFQARKPTPVVEWLHHRLKNGFHQVFAGLLAARLETKASLPENTFGQQTTFRWAVVMMIITKEKTGQTVLGSCLCATRFLKFWNTRSSMYADTLLCYKVVELCWRKAYARLPNSTFWDTLRRQKGNRWVPIRKWS